MVYFPATLGAWFLCASLSVALSYRQPSLPETDVTSARSLRLATAGLLTLGLLLAVGTLFVA
jgi:hypothetical protein